MTQHWSRRSVIAAGAAMAALPALRTAQARQLNWEGIQSVAKGQTVHFNAWGGDQRINDYIAWAGTEIKERAGVEVRHVKLADTAEAVSRIVAEKAAGQGTGGSVDLIWINGENFAALKSQGLLFGPVHPPAAELPEGRSTGQADRRARLHHSNRRL